MPAPARGLFRDSTMARTFAKGSLLWALLPVALSAVVYVPILDNYFWADDFFSLYRIRNLPLSEYLFLPLGDHLLVSAFSVFYLTYLAFGTEPQGYFATVLAVHLLNVMLFFLVLRRATGSDRLASAGAMLWGTSPRLEGTLGWYSVFGQAMAAAAILTLFYQLAGLERATTLRWRQRIAWVALVLVAATSFGIGIGFAVLMPVIAWLLVPPSPLRRRAVATLMAAAAAVPVLYVSLNRIFNAHYTPGSLANRLSATFGEAFFKMVGDLSEYGIATSLLGVFWPLPRLASTTADVALVVFALLAVIPLIGGPPRSRRYALAALLMSFASYAMVASGRASFYMLNPTIAYSDRYQYTAALTIILSVCIGLRETGRHLGALLRTRAARALPSPRVLAYLAGGAVVAWAAALTWQHERWGRPIDHHPNARSETARVIAEIQARVAAAPPGRDVYIQNRPFGAMGPIFIRSPMFPGVAGVFVIFFPDNLVDGRRVLFVEPERRFYGWAKRGRRSAKLLVPRLPGAPPPAPVRNLVK